MKKNFHPKLLECQVTCTCGHSFTIKSIEKTLKLDICSKCHPFFTGSEKTIDTAGRIEKFNRKYNLS